MEGSSWQIIKLKYCSKSALHLGDYKFGFIQKTRYFIPGWTLWGAITAQLTRFLTDKADGTTYEKVGIFVKNNVRTSYAYINDEDQILFPEYCGNSLMFGMLSSEEFENQYISSMGKTAVLPATMGAETAALHEIEVISRLNGATKKPVIWQFYIYIRQPYSTDCQLLTNFSSETIIQSIKHLFIGGDRKYGLGLLEKLPDEENLPEILGDSFVPVDWDNDKKVLRAHKRIDPAKLNGSGYIENIPFRWWDNSARNSYGPGQSKQAYTFIKPGSKLEIIDREPILGDYGIWY